MRKVILLFSVVALMVFMVNKPLFEKDETFRGETVKEKDSKAITAWEVSSFLEVWPDYVDSFVSRLGVSNLSLTTSTNIKKKLSYITIAWLNRRGWEADRFFYVEERLRTIVAVAQTEDHSAKIIAVLEKQMATEKNSNVKANIATLIENQKKNLDTSLVTAKELEIVRPYMNNISDILDLGYNKRYKNN